METLDTPPPTAADEAAAPRPRRDGAAATPDPHGPSARAFALPALAATALAACGGGSGDGAASGTSGAGSDTAADPTAGSITPAQAARFLQQAQFSSTEAEIAAVQAKGYARWLDEQMSATSHTSGWDWLVAHGYQQVSIRFNSGYADHMMWNQLIAAGDAVRKRVALAWSEIMVVSTSGIDGYWPSFAMAAYWDLLNRHAFGNYRELLEAVTLNPAMGAYLNTLGNKKANDAGRVPDENYAREVMQLFTIGLHELNADGTLSGGSARETYGPEDVSSLACVFTGYTLDSANREHESNPEPLRRPMKLDPTLHAGDAVTVLGQGIPAGDGAARLQRALDILFNHANVGPFIGRQLIQRLVTSHPSAAYVGRVAAAFNDNGAGVRGDLRAVTKAVLLDPEARQDPAQNGSAWGKLREPMIRFVQWARTFGATSSDGEWILWDLSDPSTSLGQSPLRSPSVFNFFRPGYVPPGTALAERKQPAPEFQITNENSVAGYLNFMQNTIAWGAWGSSTSKIWVESYTREMALVADSAALVDRVNLLLAAGRLSAATVATIRGAIDTINPNSDWARKQRVWSAIMLTMACPEYLVQQ
ncbi:DUF1800 domain-containing protein [Ottowia sp.]|uniref:DUF1800 domain-containing protein n=1 Tax=Ottowia sp. TaxID=1898956 RepID=UPI0039E22FDD